MTDLRYFPNNNTRGGQKSRTFEYRVLSQSLTVEVVLAAPCFPSVVGVWRAFLS